MQARTREAWKEGYSIHAILMILRDDFPNETQLLQEPMLRTKMSDFGIFRETPNAQRTVRNKSYQSPKIRKYLDLFKAGIGPVADQPKPAPVEMKVPERIKRPRAAAKPKAPKLVPVKAAKLATKLVIPVKQPPRKRSPTAVDWDWFEMLSPETRRRAEVVREYQRGGGTETLTYDEISAILAERDKRAA